MDMPFAFVMDYLDPISPTVRQMFGTYSVYAEGKIYLATRLRDKGPEDNGIWIGTEMEHHESLRAEFPALTPLNSIPIKKWLLLSNKHEDFEVVARELCLLIVAEDTRLGVVPKVKKKKSK